MSKKDKAKPDRNLHDEANEYVAGLPDETAGGRFVGDGGVPSDPTAWEAEEEEQQSALRKPRDL